MTLDRRFKRTDGSNPYSALNISYIDNILRVVIHRMVSGQLQLHVNQFGSKRSQPIARDLPIFNANKLNLCKFNKLHKKLNILL